MFKFHICIQRLKIDYSMRSFVSTTNKSVGKKPNNYSEINKAPNKREDENTILPLTFLVGQSLDDCIYSSQEMLTELVKIL